jgi:hypothetical protein
MEMAFFVLMDTLFHEVRERAIQTTHHVSQGPRAHPVGALLLRQKEQ